MKRKILFICITCLLLIAYIPGSYMYANSMHNQDVIDISEENKVSDEETKDESNVTYTDEYKNEIETSFTEEIMNESDTSYVAAEEETNELDISNTSEEKKHKSEASDTTEEETNESEASNTTNEKMNESDTSYVAAEDEMNESKVSDATEEKTNGVGTTNTDKNIMLTKDNYYVSDTMKGNMFLSQVPSNSNIIRKFNLAAFNYEDIKVYRTKDTYYYRPAIIVCGFHNENGVLYSYKNCFCLGLGVSLPDYSYMNYDSNYGNLVNEDIRKKIGIALGNGQLEFEGGDVSLGYKGTTVDQWINYYSTQLVVWNLLGQMDFDALVKNCTNGYGDYNYCVKLLDKVNNYDRMPIFTDLSGNYNDSFKMEYNNITNRYETTIRDVNYYKDFNGNNISQCINFINNTHSDSIEVHIGDDGYVYISSINPISKDNMGYLSFEKSGKRCNLSYLTKDNLQPLCYGDLSDELFSKKIYFYTENRGYIKIHKRDESTKNPLKNVTFSIYKDKECKQYVESVVTNNDGIAISNNIEVGTYYIKEDSNSLGYIIDTSVYEVIVDTNKTSEIEITNRQVTYDLYLSKYNALNKDMDDICTEDASLEGAIYGLYAREVIEYEDKSGGIYYRKDDLVNTFPMTDNKGHTFLSNLHGGKYYVKEISPSRRINYNEYSGQEIYSYYIDETEYDVELCCNEHILGAENTSSVEVCIDVGEQPILQPIVINKYYEDTNGFISPLEDIGFNIYSLNSMLDIDSSFYNDELGIYDIDAISEETWNLYKDARIPITQNNDFTIYTNEEGVAKTIPLYTGRYIIREVEYPDYVIPSKPELIDLPRYDKEILKSYDYICNNKQATMAFSIKKIDGETKEIITNNKAVFTIYDCNKKLYLTQDIYDKDNNTYKESNLFETDTNGIVNMYKDLEAGEYVIEEHKAPSGYSKTDSIHIYVNNQGIYRYDIDSNLIPLKSYIDSEGKYIYQLEIPNYKSYGKIVVNKTCETICGYDTTNDLDYGHIYTPIKEYSYKSGIEFDILDDHYNLVDSIVTDIDGQAESLLLETDKCYYIREKQTGYEYVPIDDIEIMLKSGDTNEIVTEYVEIENRLCNLRLICFKNGCDEYSETMTETGTDTKSETNSSIYPLEGAVFGLYCCDDIYIDDNIVVKKDSLLGVAKSDEEGLCCFQNVFRQGQYYIKELKSPNNYRLDTNPYFINIDFTDPDLFNSNQVVKDMSDTLDKYVYDIYVNNGDPIINYKISNNKLIFSEQVFSLGIDDYIVIVLATIGIILVLGIVILKRNSSSKSAILKKKHSKSKYSNISHKIHKTGE